MYRDVDQEATVRTRYGTTDWFKLGKQVSQSFILSPCLFNLYAEYIMEIQDWMNHNLESRLLGEILTTSDNPDDTTLMAESKEELKSLLMRVKESEKADLKLKIKKSKIMASSPMTSWQIEGEKVEAVTDFLFLGSNITADGDCSHEIRR